MEKRQSSSSSRSLHSRGPCLYFLECVGDPVSFGILLMLEMCLNPSGGTGDWGSGKPYSKTGYARANTAGFLLDGSSLVGDRRRGKWARKRSTYGGLTLVGPPSVLNGQSPSQAQVRATNTPLTRQLRLLQVPLVSVSTENRPTRHLSGAAGPYAWRPKGVVLRSSRHRNPLHGLRAQRPTTTIPSSAPHSFRRSTTSCSDCPIANGPVGVQTCPPVKGFVVSPGDFVPQSRGEPGVLVEHCLQGVDVNIRCRGQPVRYRPAPDPLPPPASRSPSTVRPGRSTPSSPQGPTTRQKTAIQPVLQSHSANRCPAHLSTRNLTPPPPKPSRVYPRQ